MKLLVNGQERELASTVTTLETLLAELRYGMPVFVLSLNGAIVKSEDYAAAALAEGDEIDIYNLVDGG